MNSRFKVVQIITKEKQRIPRSSCTKKETVDKKIMSSL